MVDILCPHCEEEIALDDDASGEFVCPYCDGEFEWNVQPEVGLDPNWFQEYNESNGRSNPIFKIISRGIFGSFFLAGIVMIVVGIAGLTISSSIWGSLGESSSSDNSWWIWDSYRHGNGCNRFSSFNKHRSFRPRHCSCRIS